MNDLPWILQKRFDEQSRRLTGRQGPEGEVAGQTGLTLRLVRNRWWNHILFYG
jgi:hypothetical protein